MKKLLLIISLIYSCYSLSQNVWIDQGAEWYYNYTNVAEKGFVHTQYVGDTTILGVSCQKITQRKDRYYQSGPGSGYTYQGSVNLKTVYTYSSNDSVFYLNNGVFNLLYDFGAQVGDTWVIDINSDTLPCSKDSSVVIVDSIGNILINGTNYRWIATSTMDSSAYSLSGIYIERFGSFGIGNLFPLITTTALSCDSGVVYEFDFYSFHCFNDQSFSFAKDSSLTCSQPVIDNVGINENNKNNRFRIFPNPLNYSETLNIKTDEINLSSVNILNAVGKVVLTEKTNTKKINISALQEGIYFIQLFNDRGLIGTKQFIIAH